MTKKLLTILILFLITSGCVFSGEIPVKVETLVKITTSNNSIYEGDTINFVAAEDVFVNSKLYIKKGEQVSGVITSLVNNGFTCQEASVYAENFKVKTANGQVIKLKGIVYKKGRNHWMFTQFLPSGFVFIRGGEAQILPGKDSFILYLETNDDL